MKVTHMKTRLTLSLTVLTALLSLGCSQNMLDFFGRSFVPLNFDKSAMLAQTLDQVVLPGYREFESRSQALSSALSALADQPDSARLETARKAWKDATEAWVKTEAYAFGPATEQRIRQQVHFWPRRPADIEAVLKSSEPIHAASYGTTRKGLPVIEYLLFGPPSAGLLAPANERPRLYARTLGQDLLVQSQSLTRYWADSTQRQRLSQDASLLNQQLNQWVMLLEDSKNKRLGLSLGLDSGSKPDPDLTEAPDSRWSRELLNSALAGFETQYLGGSGPGLDEYLIALGQRSLNTRIQTQLKTLRQDLSALTSLEQGVSEDPATVRKAYDDSVELLRSIKVDLANALNETVHFTDNDGD